MWQCTTRLIALWAAVASLLASEYALATRTKQIERPVIQAEYDFIICGGSVLRIQPVVAVH